MNKKREILRKILSEGFLNYTGYTHEEIDMKKLEKAPYKRKKLKRVTCGRRCLQPMPKEKAVLSFHRQFSLPEYEKLSYGIQPANEDEKWAIFIKNEWLCFYRGWDGECAFLLKMKKTDKYYFVKEAWMNPSLQLDEEYAVKFLNYLIGRLLLSKAVAFPFPPKMVDPMERALFRHAAVGSSLANDEE